MFTRILPLLCVFVFFAGELFATSIEGASLEKQVCDAAVIAVGRVKEVKMKGRFGWPVWDLNAQTGPGSSNSLWLIVEFDRSAVLKGKPEMLPAKKALPIWKGWIKDLKSEKEASERQSFIFFLTTGIEPASNQFQHFNFERAAIDEVILAQKKVPNHAAEPASQGLGGSS